MVLLLCAQVVCSRCRVSDTALLGDKKVLCNICHEEREVGHIQKGFVK